MSDEPRPDLPPTMQLARLAEAVRELAAALDADRLVPRAKHARISAIYAADTIADVMDPLRGGEVGLVFARGWPTGSEAILGALDRLLYDVFARTLRTHQIGYGEPRGPNPAGPYGATEAEVGALEQLADRLERLAGVAAGRGGGDWIVCTQGEVALYVGRSVNTAGLMQKLADRGELVYERRGKKFAVRMTDPARHEELRAYVARRRA